VSGSCRTRIPGWSNPIVYWSDAAAFKCNWENRQTIWVVIEGLVTPRGAPGSTKDKPGGAEDKPGSADN